MALQFYDLNCDALFHIGRSLHRCDLSALTRTCWYLHDALLPLLVYPAVTLHKRILPSFYVFLSNNTRRMPSLSGPLRSLVYRRSFTIIPPSVPPTATTFFRVLQLAPHLTSLTIRSVIEFLTPDDLHSSLALLPRLEHIELHGLTPDYEDILLDVVPYLRSAFLDVFMNDMAVPMSCVDPLPFLRTHATHLASLQLVAAKLSIHTPSLANVRTLAIQCLQLSSAGGASPWIVPLVRQFPNLEELVVGALVSPEGWILATESMAPQLVREWRRIAETWQAQYGTWASGLRYLRMSSFSDIYVLGPSCGITRMEVVRIDAADVSSNDTARTVLSRASPRYLSLGNSIALKQSSNELLALLDAISRTPSLTHVSVSFRGPVADAKSIFRTLGEALRGSSVSHLSLRADTDETLAHVSKSWPDLTQSVPALQRLFLCVDHELIEAWERVEVGEGGRSWERLGGVKGWSIWNKEGMALRR
ncbi:hypothetical protein C8Q77DRAFT_572420 [Trametes polyzona]|nr:hypothetical protein C8Q77DRAFT_572420 [Trametes polyzona]